MRLPQSFLRSFSAPIAPTIAVAIALLGVFSVRAGATTQQLSCSPAGLGFGDVVIGETETLLVTLTNNGPTSVTVSEITVSNPGFSVPNPGLPLTVLAGESVYLNVIFTPTAKGQTSGTVKFSSNASNAALQLNVGGDGVNSESITASPSNVSFGQVPAGTSSTVPVVLTNDRSWRVTLTSAKATGSGFSVSGAAFPLTLDAGQSVTLNLTFAPQSVGTDGGSLFVFGPAVTVPLTGTGTTATPYSVSLSWNYSSDAVGYNVYRSSAANGKYSQINSALDSTTTYTDSTVVSGKTYYYAAASVNSSGQQSALSTPAVEAVIP
jgi:hypothetical protein